MACVQLRFATAATTVVDFFGVRIFNSELDKGDHPDHSANSGVIVPCRHSGQVQKTQAVELGVTKGTVYSVIAAYVQAVMD